MAPSRSPIHFTNELEVVSSPETIWSLLVDPKAWPGFYPGVEHIQLLDGHESPRFGMEFETNLAGQDRICVRTGVRTGSAHRLGGYPKASPISGAYHAWIMTPTPKGCHLWTEETMQGPYWTELAKKAPDAFWLTQEELLRNLAKVANERDASHR
jgi:hypothetical protein